MDGRLSPAVRSTTPRMRCIQDFRGRRLCPVVQGTKQGTGSQVLISYLCKYESGCCGRHDGSYTNTPNACCIRHVGDSLVEVVELGSFDSNMDYVLTLIQPEYSNEVEGIYMPSTELPMCYFWDCPKAPIPFQAANMQRIHGANDLVPTVHRCTHCMIGGILDSLLHVIIASGA